MYVYLCVFVSGILDVGEEDDDVLRVEEVDSANTCIS